MALSLINKNKLTMKRSLERQNQKKENLTAKPPKKQAVKLKTKAKPKKIKSPQPTVSTLKKFDPVKLAKVLIANCKPGVVEKLISKPTFGSADIVPECFFGLFQQKRYKIYFGGRGGAKSWSIARALINAAYEKPLRILCTREFQSSIADSVHRLISDQISDMRLSDYFDITKTAINSTAGAQFIFKGLQHSIQEIKSTEGIDICWVEEAQAISETSWEILIPTIRKNNSEIWISFNPDQESDPTYQRFVKNTPPSAIKEKVGWEENPHFPTVLDVERRYMLEIDPEAYEHVWGGHCRTISDAVIYRGRFEISTFPDPPVDTRLYYGLDFGFSQSPQVAIRCWVADNILYVSHEAWGIGVELDDTANFLDQIPGVRSWPIKADCSRPETISHLRRKGFDVSGAEKWPGSVEDGISVLKGFKKIVIHERCKHCAEEFRLYKYKVDKQTNEILPIIIKKFDNFPDAIRYSLVGVIKHSNLLDKAVYQDYPT